MSGGPGGSNPDHRAHRPGGGARSARAVSTSQMPIPVTSAAAGTLPAPVCQASTLSTAAAATRTSRRAGRPARLVRVCGAAPRLVNAGL